MMTRTGTILTSAVLFGALLVAPAAYADVISPEVEACSDKGDGEDCEVDDRKEIDGECVPSTCGRYNYGAAGGGPTWTEYECLKCEETSGGCSVAEVGSAAGPWLLALTVPLFVAARSRRRRR
jgi:hypothetical protein